MGQRKNGSKDWISSLISEFRLTEEKRPIMDMTVSRKQVEESQLAERIRQTVKIVNEKVGYQALYLLDFLPPQRPVLRVSFSKKKTEYILEIVLRTSGPAVVFHSVTKIAGPWERYLYGYSRSVGSRVAHNEYFNPAAITDETIKTWFSFLLSGFDKKFNPGAKMGSSDTAANDLNGLLDKATA